jgi:dipeptidyl-peptidase-4
MNQLGRHSFRLAGAVTLLAASVAASAAPVTAQLTTADYARAERFLASNYAKYVDNAEIKHHWLDGQDRFWYVRSDGPQAHQFVVVDAATGARSPAFDHQIIADGLSALRKTPIKATALPIYSFRYAKDGKAIEIFGGPVIVTCQLAVADCKTSPAPKYGEVLSPDGRYAAFLRDSNLWVRSTGDGQETALTTDGVQYHGYGTLQGVALNHVRFRRMGLPDAPVVLWSPDSKRLLSYRLDERDLKLSYLVQSVPEDGSVRPRLWSFPFAMPDDKARARMEPIIFDIAGRSQTKLQTEPWFATHGPAFQRGEAWWTADGKSLYFLQNDQYWKQQTLNQADPATGRVRQILKETSQTFVQMTTDLLAPPIVRTLSNGDVVWYSERTGWGQLYLVDGKTGAIRNRITNGDWTVRHIARIDEAAKRLYFLASGREPGDLYHRYLYVVNFDGSNLHRLTPEAGDHVLPHEDTSVLIPPLPLTTEASRDRFSPSGRYFVDEYSTPTTPPVFLLRRTSGALVKSLEKADISRLVAGGYVPIEPFEVTAADGKTRLFGNLYRPSNFDPAKTYPVIESIYPGPQLARVGHGFGTALWGTFDSFEAQSLAELGFIVVTIDGRGTPGRSKTFQDYGYGRPDKSSDLDDHIAGLRQLAARYPQLDLTRVGMDGLSGGGYATAHALLAYPDFYKVGVSAAGNQDQRGYAAPFQDVYIGPADSPGYTSGSNLPLAKNLKGKLMLITGEMDDNVSPTLTLKLVDALIKANKNFDLLVVPNADHGAVLTPYAIRRKWDYFVRNLLDAAPPEDYQVGRP